MKSVYEFSDYRVALKSWISSSSAKGYQARLAKEAGVSSSLLSLILKGEKNLSLEQAVGICEYFGFDSDQTQYFFLLVEIGRAGSEKLRKILSQRVNQFRNSLARRVGDAEEVADQIKSIYYSHWAYTGIRNFIATDGSTSAEKMATKMKLPVSTVMRVLNFLRTHNLIVEERNKLKVSQKRIHVDRSSIFVQRHHANWRLKAINELSHDNSDNVFFTSPMSLSAEAAEEIKRRIPQVIEEIMAISGPSESEKVYCLNLDWFQYAGS